MINPQLRQLIHAAVDGELDRDGKAELERHLAESPEAREYHDAMKELDAFLGSVPPREPPEDLHTTIMDSVRARRVGKRAPALGFGRLPGFLRYGFAAAAGLLLATGIYEYGPRPGDAQDLSEMAGTILPPRQAARDSIMDRVSFDLDTLSSEVTLYRQQSALVIDVDLEARSGPVEVRVDFAGHGLDFDAIAQMQSELSSIEVADNEVRIMADGSQHFAILLNQDRAEGRAARIDVSWTSNGQLLKNAQLVAENDRSMK